jgi:hypothetical protein
MQNNRQRKPFKCKKCAYELAQHTGEQIFFGTHEVPMYGKLLQLVCPKCGCENCWRKGEKVEKEMV